jgi:hypothetical protein
MKRLISVLVVAALATVVGCNTSGTGGSTGSRSSTTDHSSTHQSGYGPGDTHEEKHHLPAVGGGQDTFRLSGPLLATAIKQGERKEITVSASRGSDFKQDIQLKITAPNGLKVTPANPVIKAGDKEAKLEVEVAKDAPIGDQTISINGVPAEGAATATPLEVKVKVEKGG